MVFELPAPPPGTRFQRDPDEAGRPRLTWPGRITRIHGLRAVATVIGLCAVLYFLLWTAHYEIDYSPDGPLGERIWWQLRRGNGKLLGLSFFILLLLLFLLLVLILFVRALLFKKVAVRHRLTFDADALRYWGLKIPSSQPAGIVVARTAIRAVGTRWNGGLLIAAGATPFEIDPTLTDGERSWLADVIRAWAGLASSVAPPDVAPLPAGSWLQLEHNREGCLRISWLPPAEICEAGRRAVARRAWAALVGWLFVECGLVAVSAYLLVGNLAWLGCFLWLAGAAVVLGLLICTPAVLAILAELVSVRRPARPESITLGPHRLHHDPGHCYCGSSFSLGEASAVDRAELARVLVEDGPDAHVELRLFAGFTRIKPRPEDRRMGTPVDEPIEQYRSVRMGPCLRSFERIWLADTLRWWAGLPSDEP